MNNRTEKQFVLHIQSERRIIDQYVGISAKSADTATQKFNEKWNGFEAEVVGFPH